MKTMFTKGPGFLFVVFISVSSLASQQPGPRDVDGAEVNLILEGVIIASEPGSSVALVRRPEARRPRSVRVGESVYGMTLVDVSREVAVFEREGRRHLVYLDESQPRESLRIAERHEAGEAGVANGEDSTKAGTGAQTQNWLSRELERSVTEERLAKEMPVILAETGLTPRVNEGSQGLQITHLPDGTLLSEIGLLPGDVLLSVNDVRLTSISALAGLFPRLRSESEIRVVVERQGHTLGLEYRIR